MEPKKKDEPIPQSQQVTIVHAAPQEMAQAPQNYLQMIAQRDRLMTQILEFAIGATHAGQWVDQNGTPWPTAPACEVMARRCAVSWRDVQTLKRPSEDDEGSFYIYESRGDFSLPGGLDLIEAVGTCSSRDQFLGTKTKAGRALSDIDEGSVMKAAYSNMIVNGVTRLLGVRHLTWERLERLGISRGGVAKVEYQTGAKGGGEAPSKDGEPVCRMGRDKGKKLSEIPDLSWYRGVIAKDVDNPQKARYADANRKHVAEIDAELARRANSKAGTVPKQSGPDPWARTYQLCKDAGVKDISAFVAKITGKSHSSELKEEDVGKVATAIEAFRQPGVAF